jgi:hypothetical protein
MIIERVTMHMMLGGFLLAGALPWDPNTAKRFLCSRYTPVIIHVLVPTLVALVNQHHYQDLYKWTHWVSLTYIWHHRVSLIFIEFNLDYHGNSSQLDGPSELSLFEVSWTDLQVDETPFSSGESRAIIGIIESYVKEVVAYANQAPNDRVEEHLTTLDRNFTRLIEDFHLIQLRLSPHNAMQGNVKLRNAQNILKGIRDLAVDMNDVNEVWEKVPGGGRRRVLNIDLMRFMVEEGTKDHYIAKHFGLSQHTVIRIRQKEGIKQRDWTPMEPETLAEVSHPK